jgi:hypothetical protein
MAAIRSAFSVMHAWNLADDVPLAQNNRAVAQAHALGQSLESRITEFPSSTNRRMPRGLSAGAHSTPRVARPIRMLTSAASHFAIRIFCWLPPKSC